MKKKLAVIALILLVAPVFVFAQTAAAANGCSPVNGVTNIGRCVNQVYVWSMGAAGLLALVMIIFGGYMTLTAAGNADRASRGRSFIWSSILGLILLFGAYVILRTINPDLVDFSNSCVNNIANCVQTTNPAPKAPGT